MLINPKFTWGSGFGNTLNITYFQNVNAGSVLRDGSIYKQIASGEEDAWVQHDYTLSMDIRWITAEEWIGSTGWRAFLEWGREKNQIRFYQQGTGDFITSYLVEPMSGLPQMEDNGKFRRLSVTIRNATEPYEAI